MTPLAPLALARSGAIRVPLRLLTRACAFGAAPRHRRAAGLKNCGVHGIADGELASEPDPWSTSPPQREIWNRKEPPQAAQTRNGHRFGAGRDVRASLSESQHEVELLR